MCVLLYKEQQMWIESPPKTKYTRLYMCLCVREIRKINLHTYVTLCQKKTHIPLWKSSQEWNKELWHIVIQLSLSLSLFLFSEFECSTERRVTCTKERQFHRLFSLFPLSLIFWEDSPILFSSESIHLFLVRTVHLSYEPLGSNNVWGVKDLNSHKCRAERGRDEIFLLLLFTLFFPPHHGIFSWAMPV